MLPHVIHYPKDTIDDNPLFIPATARAIKILLDFYEIDIKNKKILVIGESDLVGKPTKKLLSYFSW